MPTSHVVPQAVASSLACTPATAVRMGTKLPPRACNDASVVEVSRAFDRLTADIEALERGLEAAQHKAEMNAQALDEVFHNVAEKNAQVASLTSETEKANSEMEALKAEVALVMASLTSETEKAKSEMEALKAEVAALRQQREMELAEAEERGAQCAMVRPFDARFLGII